jgi:alanine dehydrogenase
VKIGVHQEVKNHEYRVAITPIGVHELTAHGHDVYVEKGAGLGSQIDDSEYAASGAKILDGPDEVWDNAEMVLKVKEPVAEEYHRMHEGLTLFTYLHLAADKPLTEELISRKVTGIAYETVQLPSGGLPLLYPMSEVAACSWAASVAWRTPRSSSSAPASPVRTPRTSPSAWART